MIFEHFKPSKETKANLHVLPGGSASYFLELAKTLDKSTRDLHAIKGKVQQTFTWL